MNTYKENLRSYNRYEGGICTKKEEGISVVKRRERGGMRVYQGTVKKRVY